MSLISNFTESIKDKWTRKNVSKSRTEKIEYIISDILKHSKEAGKNFEYFLTGSIVSDTKGFFSEEITYDEYIEFAKKHGFISKTIRNLAENNEENSSQYLAIIFA